MTWITAATSPEERFGAPADFFFELSRRTASRIFSYCACEWVSLMSSLVVDDGKRTLRIALVTVRLKVDLTSFPPSMANSPSNSDSRATKAKTRSSQIQLTLRRCLIALD